MASGQRLRLAIDGRVLDDRYHGIGRVAFELISQLSEREDCDLVLFMTSEQQTQRFDLAGLTDSPRVEVVRFEHSISGLTQFLFWPSALRKARVDASLFPYHLGATLFGGGSRRVMVHDCIFETDSRYAISRTNLLLYRIATWLQTRRSTALAPSAATAEQIAKYYRVPAAVIPLGVRGDFSASGSGRLQLPDKYYLHVGARRPHKNTELLLEVLARLPADEHLVLVGTADARWPDRIDEVAGQLAVADRVLSLPRVDEHELRALYRNARAFLYPSLVEGFGLPLLEAMAAGTPVVASDIAVFREVAGDAALFADPQDPQAWVAAIRQLESAELSGRQRHRGAVRAAAASWSRAAERLAEELQLPGTQNVGTPRPRA